MTKGSVKASSTPVKKSITSGALLTGIKTRLHSIKYWIGSKLVWNEPISIKERICKLEETVFDLVKHGIQRDAYDRETRVKWIENYKSHFNENLKKEREKRIAHSKVLEKRIIKKMADNINQGISAVSDLQEQLQERENKIDEALKRLKTQEKVLDYYLNKFNYMENLAKSAEEKYNQFLKNLKKDISEFAITHQVTKRIASVETRITQLEISHNGSGENASSAIGAHQN
jgi:uncharacterized protein YPO0396